MSPELTASLLTSLATHDWQVLATVTHTAPGAAGLQLTDGVSTVTGPATPARTDRTYQLRSEKLGLTMLVMAELVDDAFESMAIYYKGSAFETDDVDIYNAIVALGGPALEAIGAEFTQLLRTKFASATLATSLEVN